MPSLLQNTNNAFQLTHSTESCMNGGGGYGVTMESLANDANNHQGHNRVTMVPYSNCGKQGGGGSGLGSASHALNFNHQGAASYGFDEQGAAVSNELRGSYPAMTQHNNKQHCGGRKRRRRRRKKTNKKRKSYRKFKKSKRTRKSRRKSRKSKKSRRRVVRRKRKTKQRGGSSITYMTLDKSLSGNNARLFSNHSYTSSNNNCGDGYNHYTGGKTKTLY